MMSLLRMACASYRKIFDELIDYFRRWGSWQELVTTPFTHAALLLTLLSYSSWTGSRWSDLCLLIEPPLLGFSLAAYALLFSFGDEKFRATLATRKSTSHAVDAVEGSILLSLSATFLHFILIQIVAIVLASLGNQHLLAVLERDAGWRGAVACSWVVHDARNIFAASAFFMFALSLTTSAASALNIYHLTRWYVQFRAAEEIAADAQDL